jgi:hypothetical protein
MRHHWYLNLLICFTGMMCPQLQAQNQPLAVERHGDHLQVAAPQLHFLEGKPVEQLHNGASVTYVFALTLTAGQSNKALWHVETRFVVSFDLWEERFSVVQTTPPGRSGSNLTAAAAEAWCLDNMPVPLPTLAPEKTFMIKLECQVAEEEGEGSTETASRLTLAGLIDVFSRKERAAPLRWEALSGPLRLADLKDKK